MPPKDDSGALLLGTPVSAAGGMATGLFTPTEAAVAAVAWALFLGFGWYRTLSWRMIVKISMDTIESTAVVLFIVAAASIFAWVLTTTRVTEAIAVWVLSISDNPLVFLLLVNVFLLFVGCFMETIAAITILVPVFMPIIAKLGIDPVHFGLVMVLNLMIGLLTLGGYMHTRHPLSVGAEFIIDTIRGIPMLVIILYIGLPLSGAIKQSTGGFIDPPNMLRGIVAMALAYSAYLAEIFRSGIKAVPVGQIEAARSLGMTYVQAMRYVILPQALRVILPPVGNEFKVNAYTPGAQTAPAVTGLADGGWVVTYTDQWRDGSGYSVWAQRFDAAGSPAGAEFRVNSQTSGSQYDSAVSALGDGFGVGNIQRRPAGRAAAHASCGERAGKHDEQVAAHRADRLLHGVLRALPDGHHDDHGADADHHAEQRAAERQRLARRDDMHAPVHSPAGQPVAQRRIARRLQQRVGVARVAIGAQCFRGGDAHRHDCDDDRGGDLWEFERAR